MVTVYEKPACSQCDMTKKVMKDKGIEYRTKSLEEPENLEFVKGLGHLSAPVVVTEGESWSGFRPDKILTLVA